MSDKTKRSIVIVSLCIVLGIMVVAYAVYGSVLNVNGTTSIANNFKILITKIESKNATAGATDASEPTYENLTATFKTNLVSPGDSIEYDITISNQGNMNAALDKIDIHRKNNPAINITYEGIEAGEVLNAGSSTVLTLKVEFNKAITSQPKDTETEFNIDLTYVEEGQAKNSSTTTNDIIKVGNKSVYVVTEGDGLYADTYEPGRYVYKGGNPDNYITFNGEDAGWRIIAVEADKTIKIMRATILANQAFDPYKNRTTGYCATAASSSWGCNVWATTKEYDNNSTLTNGIKGSVDKDSALNIYLNGTYYNEISHNKNAIDNHLFYYGPVIYQNTDLSAQIMSEQKYSVRNNIGLIGASDYLRANSNVLSCGTYKLHYDNRLSCKDTNWMTIGNYWTMSPHWCGANCNSATSIVRIDVAGHLWHYNTGGNYGVVPVIYLKFDTLLSGSGTEEDPFKITNYTQ